MFGRVQYFDEAWHKDGHALYESSVALLRQFIRYWPSVPDLVSADDYARLVKGPHTGWIAAAEQFLRFDGFIFIRPEHEGRHALLRASLFLYLESLRFQDAAVELVRRSPYQTTLDDAATRCEEIAQVFRQESLVLFGNVSGSRMNQAKTAANAAASLMDAIQASAACHAITLFACTEHDEPLPKLLSEPPLG